jgi:flagellar biosynthesis chaperone FliJ
VDPVGEPHQCLKIWQEKKIERQVNPLHFTKFEKIQRNSEKIDQNAFDERKEPEFFENTKIGRISR